MHRIGGRLFDRAVAGIFAIMEPQAVAAVHQPSDQSAMSRPPLAAYCGDAPPRQAFRVPSAVADIHGLADIVEREVGLGAEIVERGDGGDGDEGGDQGIFDRGPALTVAAR